jgi:hypothetical protein
MALSISSRLCRVDLLACVLFTVGIDLAETTFRLVEMNVLYNSFRTPKFALNREATISEVQVFVSMGTNCYPEAT